MLAGADLTPNNKYTNAVDKTKKSKKKPKLDLSFRTDFSGLATSVLTIITMAIRNQTPPRNTTDQILSTTKKPLTTSRRCSIHTHYAELQYKLQAGSGKITVYSPGGSQHNSPQKTKKCLGGGTGRRVGLKNLWTQNPCGFDSHPRHKKNSSCYTTLSYEKAVSLE